MNLLVGATGFIGGHLVEYLFQQGEISKGVFRKGSHLKILDSNGVQGIEADLTDHHSLHEAMEGVDAVYNLASPMPGSDTDFLRANAEGVLNLLEAAAESKVKAFVHLSTLDVYGFRTKHISASDPFNPSSDYQKSKAEAERLLGEFSRRNQLPRIAIVRAAKAIGARDESLVVPILRMIESGKVVLPKSGPMSYSHPKDVAQAMYRAASEVPASASSYLLKSFDATPEELGRGIAVSMGREVEIRGEGLFSGTRLPRYTTEQLRAALTIDEQPGWKALGYSPAYTLKNTCEEIANWCKREPWVVEDA